MDSNRWWVVRRPNPSADLRLICFSYAGGGASAYANWHSSLPANVEVVALQLPGRETRFREPLLADLAVVVDKIEFAIAPLMDRPCVFFGHSLGGLIAYEVAKRLRDRERDLPKRLIVSGKRAPQYPPRRMAISLLPDADFVREIANYDGTPDDLLGNAEFIELILPRLRADARLFDDYVYSPCEILPCPITAFGGDSDVHVNRPELLGWAELTSAFDWRVFNGGHFFIKSGEAIVLRELAQILSAESCAATPT